MDPGLLRHELAHVATLHEVEEPRRELWLTEGLAEHIATTGTKAAATCRRPETRDYARMYWSKQINLPEWTSSADMPGEDLSALYGLARLSVACLARTYGEQQTLKVFDLAVRHDNDPAMIAEQALGVPWKTANGICAALVDKQLR